MMLNSLLKCRTTCSRTRYVVNTQGRTPLYKPLIGVCCHKEYGFWAFSGLKTDINFAHFGLELGLVFEETTGAYT